MAKKSLIFTQGKRVSREKDERKRGVAVRVLSYLLSYSKKGVFVNLNFRIFIIAKNLFSIKMLSCLKKLKMLVH